VDDLRAGPSKRMRVGCEPLRRRGSALCCGQDRPITERAESTVLPGRTTNSSERMPIVLPRSSDNRHYTATSHPALPTLRHVTPHTPSPPPALSRHLETVGLLDFLSVTLASSAPRPPAAALEPLGGVRRCRRPRCDRYALTLAPFSRTSNFAPQRPLSPRHILSRDAQ